MRSPQQTGNQGQEAAAASSGGAAREAAGASTAGTAATPPPCAGEGAIAGAVGPGPVSVVITLHVAPTRESAFEEAERRVLAAVMRWPGYIAHNVLRGPRGPSGRDYDIIFRFTDEASWQSWHDSEE